jgi:hypothetical protein
MKDIIITLLGVALISSLLMMRKKDVKENWMGILPQTYYTDPLVGIQNSNPTASSQMSIEGGKTQMYTVPPNYQSILAPRFSNVGYGANINYNLPAVQNLAMPENPLTYGDSMIDNLPSGGLPSCSYIEGVSNIKQTNSSKETYEPIGNQQSAEKLKLADSGIVTAPVQSNIKVEDDGVMRQYKNYDQLIYSGLKSRLQSYGVDRIRGDLPITPSTYPWFRPSTQPNRDLTSSGIRHISSESSTEELETLKSAYSAGQRSAYSQVLYPTLADKQQSHAMSAAIAQKQSQLQAAGSDIVVTSFP